MLMRPGRNEKERKNEKPDGKTNTTEPTGKKSERQKG
jgi:hypothetical protein